MNIFSWINQELSPRTYPSTEFMYDDMESQSDRWFPIIYRPFDATKKSHWHDRGWVLDFVCSVGTGRVLDFGPGDGWPSLPAATWVNEVVGVDGSRRRRDVCEENARRMGIENAQFLFVPAGAPLPFDDESFDGIMAASSVEQTPDPEATLRELYRVLRPGGRLRLLYEALGGYRNGREQEADLLSISERSTMLTLYDRNIEAEQVESYGIVLAMSQQDVRAALWNTSEDTPFKDLTVPLLQGVIDTVTEVRQCHLRLPSGRTWAEMLSRVGFSQILPSKSGADAAVAQFDSLGENERPTDLAGVDAALLPVVQAAVKEEVSLDTDPVITAVKR